MMAAIGLSACSDNENGIYDPVKEAQKNNPLGLTTSQNFDWNNLQKVSLTVKVADKYNGQYTYGVQVYDSNPVGNEDAVLLAQGTATGQSPFYANIELGKDNQTLLYVKQTTPTGEKLIRTVEVNSTNLSLDFNTKAQAKQKRQAARDSYNLPAAPADDKFATSVPTGAVNSPAYIKATGNYIVTSALKSVEATNVNLYVNSKVTLDVPSITGKNATIYILDGGELTISSKWRWKPDNTTIKVYISKGGTLTETGQYPGMDINYAIYNRGTINSAIIDTQAGALLYNQGTINSNDHTDGFIRINSGANLINEGTIYATDFNKTKTNSKPEEDNGGGVYNFGEVIVDGVTHISADKPIWYNEGQWTTNEYDLSENATQPAYNKCHLVVTKQMRIYSVLMIDAGANIEVQDLLVTKGTIKMGNGVLFNVKGKAQFKYTNGFEGIGTQPALVTIASAELENNNQAGYLNCTGNLIVACPNVSKYLHTSFTNGAQLTESIDKTGMEIPTTPCNVGHKETPATPVSVDYKHAISFSAIYAVEDNWPKMGDYDLNDVVAKVTITAFGEGQAKNEEEAKNIKLTSAIVKATFMATGADNRLGAYLQLDDVKGSDVQAKEADGLEQGQEKAVIMFTKDVAATMGGRYINVSAARTTPYKTITRELTFTNGITVAALAKEKVNFFITVNDNGSNNRTEVHLRNYASSSKCNTKASEYQSADNFVWGISLPGSANYEWPNERVKITQVNSDFTNWVTNSGASGTAWYNVDIDTSVTEK